MLLAMTNETLPHADANPDSMRAALAEIVEEHGKFNAYNVKLADGVFTRGKESTTLADARVLTMVQLGSDLTARPLDELKVLDLGPLEGLFGLEFAANGAQVVGIEGRAANVARAEFITDALGLSDNTNWTVGDARHLSVADHGTFDVVMCLGLLYHLDGDDQLPFLQRLADSTDGVTIIDTHVSTRPVSTISYGDKEYSGRWYHEHDASVSMKERMRATRSSLDNEESFWLTLPSLVNALKDVGFTSVLQLPPFLEVAKNRDRVQLVAIKGTPVSPRIEPNRFDLDDLRMREIDSRPIHKSQDPTFATKQVMARVIPEGVRSLARQMRGKLRSLRR